jgi:hypothetical protein
MGSIEVVYVIAYHAPPLWSCDYMIDHMMLICSVIISCSSPVILWLYDWSYDAHLFCNHIMLLHVILWLYDWSYDAHLFCNHIMLLHVIMWLYIWTYYDDHQCDVVIPWYDYLRNMKWLDDFDMII